MSGHVRWLGAECTEGLLDEPWRSARPTDGRLLLGYGLASVCHQSRKGGQHGRRWPNPKERQRHRAEVRAPIVASKRGNSRGAKGCRKVDPGGTARWNNNLRQCPPGLNKQER